MGRSKGITVLLEEDEDLNSGYDVTVQPMSLQRIFVAMCGEEAK
jgi:ABC-2 type transport system ATP-binding protein